MLADKVITEAGGKPNYLSLDVENLAGQIFGYIESVLRECAEEFHDCHAVLVCENWFVIPLSEENDRYFKFLYSNPSVTLQSWPFPTDSDLLN